MNFSDYFKAKAEVKKKEEEVEEVKVEEVEEVKQCHNCIQQIDLVCQLSAGASLSMRKMRPNDHCSRWE